MRKDVLWLKLSASINYFLRYNYDRYRTNEDMLNNYIYLALDYHDVEKVYMYLDKKTLDYIEIDDEMLEKIKVTFLERVDKKRKKYNHKEPISKNQKGNSNNKNNVIKLSDWRNRK